MGSFQAIACLIAHAPIEANFFESSSREEDEVQNCDKIPGWDDWLNDNSVNAYIVNNTTGRVRARAWGVSNPFTNFRSVVGAQFRFRFIVNPDQVLFPQERYRFTVDIDTDGCFLHTAATPTPDDERQPPARTFSQLDTQLTIFTIRPNGNAVQIASAVNDQDLVTMIDATEGFGETIDSRISISQEFFPNGAEPVVFRIVRNVLAAATGVYSDIRIRGSEGRRNFRVRALNPRIHKVLEVGDPCFEVLRG